MAWTFRAAATNGVLATSIAVNKPTGTVQNDLLVAVIKNCEGSASPSTPTGWTAQTLMTPNISFGRMYFLVAGASEPTSYTWTGAGAFSMQGGIATFTPPDTSTPFDVQGTVTEASSGTVTGASVDPTNADSLLVFGGCIMSDVANSSMGVAAGMTEAFDQGTNFGNVFLDYEFLSVDTATGTKTATFSDGSSGHSGQLAVFNQASAAGGLVIPVAMSSYRQRHQFSIG